VRHHVFHTAPLLQVLGQPDRLNPHSQPVVRFDRIEEVFHLDHGAAPVQSNRQGMVRNSQFFDSLIRRRKLCEVEHNLAVIEIAFASNVHMTQRPIIALGLALLLVFIGGCASHKPAPHVAADFSSPGAIFRSMYGISIRSIVKF